MPQAMPTFAAPEIGQYLVPRRGGGYVIASKRTRSSSPNIADLRLRPVSQFRLTMVAVSDASFMALSRPPCTGSPLRSLSEASIPPIAFSRHCSSRKICTPNWRDRSCTGSADAKAGKNDLTLATPSVHARQVPQQCRAGSSFTPGEQSWTSFKLAGIYRRRWINWSMTFLRDKLVRSGPWLVLHGHFD